MTTGNFMLIPFSSLTLMSSLQISGSFQRTSNTIRICYNLIGPLEEIDIPAMVDLPERRNRLWEETCFEIFLAPDSSDEYWEFNLSPCGHWNVYHFDAYREGMREEMSFSSLPLSVKVEPDSLQLSSEIEISRLVSEQKGLSAGISAVIRTDNGALSYWDLSHPGNWPDFHRRESFIVKL